jgi:hypothetical protein
MTLSYRIRRIAWSLARAAATSQNSYFRAVRRYRIRVALRAGVRDYSHWNTLVTSLNALSN